MILFWFYGEQTGLTMDAGSGPFTLSGQPVDLNIGYVASLDAGVFTLTGQELTKHYLVVLDSGVFILEGGKTLVWAGWPSEPDYNTDYGAYWSEEVVADATIVERVALDFVGEDTVIMDSIAAEQIVAGRMEVGVEHLPPDVPQQAPALDQRRAGCASHGMKLRR